MSSKMPDWLNRIKWDSEGLVPAIAQDRNTGRVLMLAWMNAEALLRTVTEGRAVYWSRTRKKIWEKGETSGYFQHISEIRIDCDRDSILLLVSQSGGIACHTGRQSCFYTKLGSGEWQEVDPVIRDPDQIYGRGTGK